MQTLSGCSGIMLFVERPRAKIHSINIGLVEEQHCQQPANIHVSVSKPKP